MKKKNIFTSLVSAVLCCAIFFSVGCAGDKNNETETNETSIKDTNIILAQNGSSRYKIVIPEDAAEVVSTGANEIATYIKLSTGAEIPVVKDSTIDDHSDSDCIISIGETWMKQNSGISATRSEVKRDGYKIKRKDNTVYIVGATERASAYGCMEFLEQQIGYEVYTAKEIDYLTYDTLYLKDFSLIDIPSFETRNSDGIAQADQDTSFRLRLGLMFGYGTKKYANTRSQDYIPNGDHNTDVIISADKNPDYAKYAGSGATQICFTQGNGIEEAYISELIKYIQEMPDAYLVNISQEDGKNFCTCDKCQEEMRLYGCSGLWIRFLNKIINGIEEWKANNCPERDLEYTTFIYGDTLPPPVDLQADGTYKIKDESCYPHEKLNLRITQNSCPHHALDDPDCSVNPAKMNYIEGWRAIANKFHIWDYSAKYTCFLPFFNDINRIKRNKEIYAEMGVTDYFTEFNSGGSFTQFGYLRLYLHANLMWDVNQDIEELTDKFFEHYYKDVAPEMRAIYNLYRTHDAVNDFTDALIDLKRFPRSLVEQTEYYFDLAEEKCSRIGDIALREKLQNRIMQERACTNFLKLYLYDGYGYDSDEYNTLYTLFVDQMTSMNMPRFSESTSMESWLESAKRN